MSRTFQHSLPLLEAAQAQKHVTVNEALARLDAVAQLRVASAAVASPPAGAVDGQAYVVPSGASGDWAGHVGEIALFANGGWVFLAARAGWSAWDEAAGRRLVFDGAAWRADAVAVSAGGAATVSRIVEIAHEVAAGASSVVTGALPAQSLVTGVTGRVTAAIAGSATGWSLGVAGSADRYGSGLGVGQGSWALGLTGTPTAYYADTDLVLTAEGGSFAGGGTVLLAVHLVTLVPPRAA